MKSLVSVLMDRDGLTKEEAKEQIAEARELLVQYIEAGDFMAAEEICMDEFGLEPDYLMELM